MVDFSTRVLGWFRQYGRYDLPWQRDRDPYRIWLAEIMLQQTQVGTVIPYFNRFVAQFPNIDSLAAATIDEVLHLWAGLGYYTRARNLHRCAGLVVHHHAGIFPRDFETLMTLPGIGRSTAGAILSLAYDQRHPILDGNVKRVITRYLAIPGYPGERAVAQRLWQLAEQFTPQEQVAAYTQAIMDLGATVCLRRHPRCQTCPVEETCLARQAATQHDFPYPRPAKPLPLRQARLLMIEDAQDRIFLQQRPPNGVWGGLWSVPECTLQIDLAQWIEQQFSCGICRHVPWERIRHTFTHFHLDIFPVYIKIGIIRPAVKLNTFPYCWYAVQGGEQRLGLPAPVKLLLERI